MFVQAMDAAGNISPAQQATVTLDRAAPAVTLADPITNPDFPAEVLFGWSIADAGALTHGSIFQTRFKLAGADNDWHDASGLPLIRYTTLAPGRYTAMLEVKDLAGNITLVERTMEVSPPRATVYLPLLAR